MELQLDSKLAAHTFIMPKKVIIKFTSYFCELNKQMVYKPLPIAKISDVLLKVKGFQLTTALDLDMGYYSIKFNLDASKYVPQNFLGVSTDTYVTYGHSWIAFNDCSRVSKNVLR